MLSEEEAIERLNRFKTIEVLYGGTFAMTLGQLERLQEAIQIILDMLGEKDKEIEKINFLYEKALDNIVTTDKENMQLKKQIRLMAEAFKQDDARTVEEIIEYFKNLVRGSEDEI